MVIWEEKKKEFKKKDLNQDIIGKIILSNKTAIPIVEGIDSIKLQRGAGHMKSSSMPGDVGNSIIFGHRDGVFKDLKYLKIKDLVQVQTLKGTYNYEVISLEIVDPKKQEIINNHYERKSFLTFVTCYPFNYIGSAPKRFVVTLVLCG